MNDQINKRPLFSVIVPIYNVEAYLPQCISSICSQTFRDFELILVDDGSVDSCPIICDQYAQHDNRIRVIHKTNGGIVSARQAGVAIAKGLYIACIDGDDWIADNYFSRFSEIISLYSPDMICCCYHEAFSDHTNIVKHMFREGFYSKEDIIAEIFPCLICDRNGKSFSSNLWAKVFKKEIYQKQQLVDVIVSMGEDDACVKPTLFHSSSLYIFNEALYYYRQNDTSVSRSKKVFSWDGPEIRANHLKNQIDMDMYDFKNQLYRSLVFSIFTVAVSQFNRNCDMKTICEDIKNNLEKPLYKEAIRNSHFQKAWKGRVRQLVLKHKLYYAMKMINERHK